LNAGEPGDRRICSACIKEPFLTEQISTNGLRGICFYCQSDGNTLSVDQIATSIPAILDDFYFRADLPLEGRPVCAVISDLIKADEDAAEDIRRALEIRNAAEVEEGAFEDDPFGADACYAETHSADTGDLEWGWRKFERTLKTEARYFNRYAEVVLNSIFDGIDSYRTRFGHSIVVEAGPGTAFTKLHRARVFQSEAKLREAMKRPDQDVGTPPASLAIAGRMNAAGIAVFYGATEPSVALAEVRPPVGSKVLVGCFEIIRPLKLLDLVAMTDISDGPGSLFDDAHRQRLKQAQFLRGLSSRLSKPVMPADQILDYLPTQAIADFLASEVTPPLDGIIYPSVQAGQTGEAGPGAQPTYRGLLGIRRAGGIARPGAGYQCNVALFQKAARVQNLDKDRDVSVVDSSALYSVSDTLDDGPGVQYTVWVGGPEDRSAHEDESDSGASLKYSSLEVHYVEAVSFKKQSSSVARYPAAPS
jgi:hypothetical protein